MGRLRSVLCPLLTNLGLADGAAEFNGIRNARSAMAMREITKIFFGLE